MLIWRIFLTFHSAAQEAAGLRNSLHDAEQQYEELQSQVASQKAHDAKVQLEKQKLEEDLKASICVTCACMFISPILEQNI